MIKVTCALIVDANKMLLTQKDGNSSHPFQWEFPGGKMQADETAANCIRREINEELELDIEIIRKLQPVAYDYGFREIELVPFLCKISSGKIKLNEHIDYQWVKWDEVGRMDLSAADYKLLDVAGNRRELEKYFRKKMDDSR